MLVPSAFQKVQKTTPKQPMKTLAIFLSGLLLGITLYHFKILPNTIDHRANDLGLMHYSHAQNKMVPTEEFTWTLYYFKWGTMR